MTRSCFVCYKLTTPILRYTAKLQLSQHLCARYGYTTPVLNFVTELLSVFGVTPSSCRCCAVWASETIAPHNMEVYMILAVYIYIHMYRHMYIPMCIYMYARTLYNIQVSTPRSAWLHTYIYIYTHTHMYIYVHILYIYTRIFGTHFARPRFFPDHCLHFYGQCTSTPRDQRLQQAHRLQRSQIS